MSGIMGKLACCLLLLALAGTVSGSGFVAAHPAGFAGRVHTDRVDALSVNGIPGATLPYQDILHKTGTCHFPIWKLPAYYVCVMVCKIGGGGNSCPGHCERMLSDCS